MEKGIEATITYASTKGIGKKAYGSMLLGINGDDETVKSAIAYITEQPDIFAEEVTASV